MLQEIYTLAGAFLEAPVEEAALERLCKAAESQLCARLRKDVSPADCHDAFIPAAAWLALSLYLEGSAADGIESFSVGDVRVTKKSDRSGQLRQQAEQLMLPYTKNGFGFQGVRT